VSANDKPNQDTKAKVKSIAKEAIKDLAVGSLAAFVYVVFRYERFIRRR
jgi:hypothetical protein